MDSTRTESRDWSLSVSSALPAKWTSDVEVVFEIADEELRPASLLSVTENLTTYRTCR